MPCSDRNVIFIVYKLVPVIQAKGYTVQSIRIVTNAFGEYLN